MTNKRILGGVIAATLAVAAVPVFAHHSFSIFDASQTKTFTGVVTRVNPDANHLQIFFAPMNEERKNVVRDEKGEGHAVLTARTVQGDFILDNKIEDVRMWSKTPYQFVMRQSYLNPKVWVALDTRQGPLATALSGLENQSAE